MALLPTFEIEPTAAQRGSVIWLHGLGATNHDFDPIVPELRAPYLRFVFPQAPLRPVTINQGMRMPAWYDILSFATFTKADAPLREKESEVRESASAIRALIEREHERGVAYENIIVAGFSQGGAMALHVGLRSAQRLGGVLVLSGYLLLQQRLEAEAQPGAKETPILFCHGRFDPVVPFAGGQTSYDRVKQAGFDAQWSEFDMEHSLCIEEVRLIGDWLAARFPKPPAS